MRHISFHRPGALLAASLAVLLAPGLVVAHAELDVATPADGAAVLGTPPEVSGTFTQDLAVDGSSLQLRDPDGKEIATGGIDPDNVRRMAITELPDLVPGDYEVRWTTLSSEDGELARGTWTFTVAVAPTPSPTPVLTAAPTAAETASSTTAPTPAPTAGPTPVPTAGDDTSGSSGGDVILPIVVALVVLGGGTAYLLSRRNRTPDAT